VKTTSGIAVGSALCSASNTSVVVGFRGIADGCAGVGSFEGALVGTDPARPSYSTWTRVNATPSQVLLCECVCPQ
jgi:hypothetical protein